MYRQKITYLLLVFGSLLSIRVAAQSEVHRFESLITDYSVRRVAYSNGYTMLAGYFSQLGPYTGGGTLVNTSTGTFDANFPKVNGTVNAIVSDGENGWYIGGYFDHVGNVAVSNLVHIKADKTVDINWKPTPDYEVTSLAREGNVLYVVGSFTQISGQARNYIASYSLPNGTLTTWNPNVNSYVYAIQPAGNVVYIGGYFTQAGGQTRNYIAALNSTGTGAATTWAPVVDGPIYAIAVTPSAVFIGGYFTNAGGQARTGLAALNPSNNSAIATWSANLNNFGSVQALGLSADGSTLYAGGYFNTVKGIARTSLAALSTTNGNVTSWNPILNDFGSVTALKISGNALYIAGYLTGVNSVERHGFAAIRLTDATVLEWNPKAGGSGHTMAFNNDNTQLLIGGNFKSLQWVPRNGFALIEEATGQPWPFELDLADGEVYTMVIHNSTLYIGGVFSQVNGTARKNLAAISLTTGQLLPWNPGATVPVVTAGDNSAVFTIEIKDNLLYIGGRFSNVNGQSRPGLAAVDLTTGVPNAWNPIVGDGTPSQYINSLHIAGNLVYVGGNFSTLENQTRAFLAAVDVTSGTPSSWAPAVTGEVFKVRSTGNTVYITGDFPKGIEGELRPAGIAAIHATSGKPTSWNPTFTFPEFGRTTITDFTLSQADIYVSGDFEAINNQPRSGLASFSLSTGELNTWKPDVVVYTESEGETIILSLANSNKRLFIGGDFERLGTEARLNYGEYDICPTLSNITFSNSTLTAPNADSYQWFKNGQPITGATSQTLEISVTEYGTYAVEASLYGCALRSNDYTYLITKEGENISSSIKIYPNPAKEEIFIDVPFRATLTIHDMLGKSLESASLNHNVSNRIEVQGLKSGVYFLVIHSPEGKISYKIFKTN